MTKPNRLPAPAVDDLFAHAIHPATLREAWEHVRARRAGPGIDRVTVDAFAAHAEERLDALHDALQGGTWTPMPGLRVSLAHDPHRPIAIATVRDRIVQRAMATSLASTWDDHIADHVYAYRPGRSVRQALQAVEDALEAGYTTWARTDLRHFFDRIDRRLLHDTLAEVGIDPRFIRLVDQLVGAGAIASGALVQDDTGIPQGSALSPVLSNLYLAPFDQHIEEAHAVVIRYADDLLVLADTPARARKVMARLERAAAERSLSLNARKTRLGDAREGFRFLGMHFDATGRPTPDMPTRHLHERLDETALREPDTARRLLMEWAAWYGPFPAEAVRSPRALLALVREACDPNPPHLPHPAPPRHAPSALERLASLARRRAWMDTHPRDVAPSAEDGMGLVQAWQSALEYAAPTARAGNSTPAERHAALDDLRAALVRDLAALLRREDAPTPELATLLGVDRDTLDACVAHEEDPLVPLHGALVAADRGQLAAAVRAVRNAPPAVEAPPAETSTLDAVPEETLDALGARWLGDEMWTEYRNTRGHHAFQQDESAPQRALRRHLAGAKRVGVAINPATGMARMLVLDVVPRVRPDPGNVDAQDTGALLMEEVRRQQLDQRQRALRWALRLVALAQQSGLDVLLEETARDRLRLWLTPEEPIATVRGARLMRRLAALAGPLDSDLRVLPMPPPEQGRRGMGVVLPLPLGRCPRSGSWSRLLDSHGEPLVCAIDRLGSVSPASAAAIAQVLGERPAATEPAPVDARPQSLQRLLAAAPRAAAILEGCAVLDSIARKGRRIGALDGDERATLFEVLGHLPEPEGATVLTELLAPHGVSEARVRKRVATLPPLPLGCRKVHTRHPRHVPGAGCGGCDGGACAAVDGPTTVPNYPSPLMHAVGVRGWSPVKRDGTWHTAAGQRVETLRMLADRDRPARQPTGAPPPRPSPTPTPATVPRADGQPARGTEDVLLLAGEAGPGGRADAAEDPGIALLTKAAGRPPGRALSRSVGNDTPEAQRLQREVSPHGAASGAADPSPLATQPAPGELPSARPRERCPGEPGAEPAGARENVDRRSVGAVDDVERLVAEILRLRRQLSEAGARLDDAEAALAVLFRLRGVTKMRVSAGWLVYRPEGTPTFVLELG